MTEMTEAGMSRDKTLAELFIGHRGKAIDKWEQYLGIYEREMAVFLARGTPVRLLEVGVQNGGSLELWADYLPPGSEIRGLDIDSRIELLDFGPRNIRVDVADATNLEEVARAIGDAKFDIIIDDGSHICKNVWQTFEILFPRLNVSGRYVIEDLHCSYYADHGGSLRAERSSIELLKRLIDALNFDYIQAGQASIEELEELKHYNGVLDRITFYDSAAVIEKLAEQKTLPYRRILGGISTKLQSPANWLPAIPVERLRNMILSEGAVAQLDRAVLDELQSARNEARAATALAAQIQAQLDALQGPREAS